MSVLHSDTICALATPHGTAGLAVIRLSGPNALAIADACFSPSNTTSALSSHHVRVGWWTTQHGRIDEVTMTAFVAPSSYTGEDVIEVGCHGGQFVVNQILQSMVAHGARPALAGEFTRRAFVNKKMDLTQVEAVADLIHAESTVGAQTAARQLAGGFTEQLSLLRKNLLASAGLLEVELDFSEEGYEFVSRQAFAQTLSDGIAMATSLVESARSAQILRSGYYVTLVGYPNAGKSSLFNALLNRPRAIVSHIPGTTRDYLQESVIIDGCTVHICDTAGLRETDDTVELQGIQITRSLIEQSNLVLVVNDVTAGVDHSQALYDDLLSRFPTSAFTIVQNKMDVINSHVETWTTSIPNGHVPASASVVNGIHYLRNVIHREVSTSTQGTMDVLVNTRQASLLTTLISHLQSAKDGLHGNSPADLIAIDVRAAIQVMGTITGETWNPDVLDIVFSQFCIGK